MTNTAATRTGMMPIGNMRTTAVRRSLWALMSCELKCSCFFKNRKMPLVNVRKRSRTEQRRGQKEYRCIPSVVRQPSASCATSVAIHVRVERTMETQNKVRPVLMSNDHLYCMKATKILWNSRKSTKSEEESLSYEPTLVAERKACHLRDSRHNTHHHHHTGEEDRQHAST